MKAVTLFTRYNEVYQTCDKLSQIYQDKSAELDRLNNIIMIITSKIVHDIYKIKSWD